MSGRSCIRAASRGQKNGLGISADVCKWSGPFNVDAPCPAHARVVRWHSGDAAGHAGACCATTSKYGAVGAGAPRRTASTSPDCAAFAYSAANTTGAAP